MHLLDQKIALVTSSTRGIGYAAAKKLAQAGAKVYLAVRRLDAAKKIVEEIEASGGKADVVYFVAQDEKTYSCKNSLICFGFQSVSGCGTCGK